MTAVDQGPETVPVQRVTFPRVLRAEWIKFWSLRSTYWAIGATLVAMILMSLLFAIGVSQSGDVQIQPTPDGTMVIGLSYSMAQLVIAVLGVLMISGEYSTGMIRSSLAAVPTRLPVLAGKAIIIVTVSFLVGVVGVALSYAITAPMLGNIGGAADLGDPETLRVFWGTGLYLAGVGLLGLGVGALLRHSAGAIATLLGVLLLLPSIVQLLGGWLDWAATAYPYLPSTAGERIVTVGSTDMSLPGLPSLLDPWPGFGVLVIYIVVLLGAAGALLRRRDA